MHCNTNLAPQACNLGSLGAHCMANYKIGPSPHPGALKLGSVDTNCKLRHWQYNIKIRNQILIETAYSIIMLFSHSAAGLVSTLWLVGSALVK